MKRILRPNNGEEIVYIDKNNFFVYITDYGTKFFLKEIKIGLAQHTWEWISLEPISPIDLSNIGNRYCTFENAINRRVNDPYCTVYEFESLDDLMACWNAKGIGEIKYIDSIKTVYKIEDGE